MKLTLEELKDIKRKSEKDTEQKVKVLIEEEIKQFNATNHKSIDVMPWQDSELIFRQQGRRVSWMYEGDKFCSARHYPNAECAKQIIDELIRLGAANCIKEQEDEEQIKLF